MIYYVQTEIIQFSQNNYRSIFTVRTRLGTWADEFSLLDRTELIVHAFYNDGFNQEYIRNTKQDLKQAHPKPMNITQAKIRTSHGRVPGKIEEFATMVEFSYTVDGRKVDAIIHGKRSEFLSRYKEQIDKDGPFSDIAKDSDMARRLFYLLQKDADNFRKLDENLFVNGLFPKVRQLYNSLRAIEKGFIS